MNPTSGLLTYLQQRLGLTGAALVLLLAVTLVLALGASVVVTAGLLAAPSETILVAPVRWATS